MKPALEAHAEESARGNMKKPGSAADCRFLGAYGDLLFEKAANDTIAEFARDKIRSIVRDPATAELLCPHNVFGCKRLCVDTGYFETYNLPHVKLVDVSKTPIERFTADGIEVNGTRVSARRHRLRDRLCGDDGIVRQDCDHGPRRQDAGREMARRPARLSRRGHGGLSQSLHHHRAGQSVGAGEHDPGHRAACRLDGRLHWRTCATSAAATIEPVQADEDEWVEHVNEVSKVSLRSTCSSWYVGDQHPRAARASSCPISAASRFYVQKCNEVMTNGFEGFVMEGADTGNEAPRVRLTPSDGACRSTSR